MPLPLDLFGKIFDNLRVMRKLPSESGYTYWGCRCKCGNPAEVKARGSHLVSRNTRSCGCLPKGVKGHYQPCGKDSYQSVLDDSTVLEARKLSREGLRLSQIIRKLKLERLDKSTVSLAINRKTWKHLP